MKRQTTEVVDVQRQRWRPSQLGEEECQKWPISTGKTRRENIIRNMMRNMKTYLVVSRHLGGLRRCRRR
jgi:hypothetical protein